MNSSKTKPNSDGTRYHALPLDASQPKQPLQISLYLKEKDRYKAFLCEHERSISGKGGAVVESLRTWEEDWVRRYPNEAKNNSKLAIIPELKRPVLLTLTKRIQDFEAWKPWPLNVGWCLVVTVLNLDR